MNDPSQRVAAAVQRHLERAEYQFDCAIADLRGEPRSESPEQRRAREAREAVTAIGHAFGLFTHAAANTVKAFADGFTAAMKEGNKQ